LRRVLPTAMLVALVVVSGCSSAGPAPVLASQTIQQLDAAGVTDLLADRDDVVVVDVRTPEEFREGHLADAVLLDLTGGVFADQVGELDRDATYLVYCRSGNRSGQAVRMMADLGFVEVYDGGAFEQLAAAGAATG
jgi:phage shock protein E